MFTWISFDLDPYEAFTLMWSDEFWQECIDHGLDAIWAYRYLYWKLNHPYLKDWLDCMEGCCDEKLPPPAVPFRIAQKNYRESLRGLPLEDRKLEMYVFNANYWVKGKTFGAYPRRPAVARWSKGWCHKELAAPGK